MNAKTPIASGKKQVKKSRTSAPPTKDLGVKDGARAVKGGVSLSQACCTGAHFKEVVLH